MGSNTTKQKISFKDVSTIETEGKFEFRIKPKIEHMSSFLNRAIEEIQKLVITHDKRVKALENKIKKLEAKKCCQCKE